MRALTGPVVAPDAHPPAPTDRVRVVLAEAHQGMRSSLRALLDLEPDIRVIADADDDQSTAGLLLERPDVLILDHKLAGKPAGETFQTLVAANLVAGSRIVIATMEDSQQLALHVLDAGAIAVVLKDRAATDLPLAIRLAARGHRYLSPTIQ